MSNLNQVIVLILILMEFEITRNRIAYQKAKLRVLILILMEFEISSLYTNK